MKPLLLSFCALLLSLCSLGQNPYLAIKADSVVFYDYNYHHIPSDNVYSTDVVGMDTNRHSVPEQEWIFARRESPIVINGRLDSTVEHTLKINKYHALQLTQRLGDTNSFGQPVANCEDENSIWTNPIRRDSCYEPHLGIVYWLKGKPVAYISVCLKARIVVPNMALQAQQSHKEKGMSKSFIELIGAIERYYNFPQ